MLKTVADGFTLGQIFRPLPQRALPYSLGQMDILRRASAYRPKWFALPENMYPLYATPTVVVPAYGHWFGQIRVVPGSYLWGFAGHIPESLLGKLWLKVSESKVDVDLFQDLVGTSFTNTQLSTLTPTPVYHVLPFPRVIMGHGLVDVDIANSGASDASGFQIMLMFAELCEIIESEQDHSNELALEGGVR